MGALLVLPAEARAQTLDTVRGLRIQQAPANSPPGPRITLDGPRPKGPLAVIYLDGQRRDSTALGDLNPDDIAAISILKPDVARQLGPDEARLGVLVVTTKAGARTHSVRAFNQRLNQPAPANLPSLPGHSPAPGPK